MNPAAHPHPNYMGVLPPPGNQAIHLEAVSHVAHCKIRSYGCVYHTLLVPSFLTTIFHSRGNGTVIADQKMK